jgi:hypothetical protein
MFKSIEPEVAGGLGEDTKLDTTTHPPVVFYLHYEFYGWLDNDILESFPCFIVTDRLREAILDARLSGVAFDHVKVTTTDEFEAFHPGVVLPPWSWMKISGKAGMDDFGISDKLRLVVSEKAFGVLSLFNISAADVEDFMQNTQ